MQHFKPMKKLTTHETRKLEKTLKSMVEYIANADATLTEGNITHDVYHDIIDNLTCAVILKAGITSALAEYGTNPRAESLGFLTNVRNGGKA